MGVGRRGLGLGAGDGPTEEPGVRENVLDGGPIGLDINPGNGGPIVDVVGNEAELGRGPGLGAGERPNAEFGVDGKLGRPGGPMEGIDPGGPRAAGRYCVPGPLKEINEVLLI